MHKGVDFCLRSSKFESGGLHVRAAPAFVMRMTATALVVGAIMNTMEARLGYRALGMGKRRILVIGSQCNAIPRLSFLPMAAKDLYAGN